MSELGKESVVSGLQESLKALRQAIQRNVDAVADLISEKEIIRCAPHPADEIAERLNRVVEQAAEAYTNRELDSVGKTLDPSQFSFARFLCKPVHVDGKTIHVVDPNALAYFLRPLFEQQFSEIAERIETPGAGLPAAERQAHLAELDAQIERLEHERAALYQQATDAGVAVREEFVTGE